MRVIPPQTIFNIRIEVFECKSVLAESVDTHRKANCACAFSARPNAQYHSFEPLKSLTIKAFLSLRKWLLSNVKMLNAHTLASRINMLYVYTASIFGGSLCHVSKSQSIPGTDSRGDQATGL